jgi:hypothetical protein
VLFFFLSWLQVLKFCVYNWRISRFCWGCGQLRSVGTWCKNFLECRGHICQKWGKMARPGLVVSTLCCIQSFFCFSVQTNLLSEVWLSFSFLNEWNIIIYIYLSITRLYSADRMGLCLFLIQFLTCFCCLYFLQIYKTLQLVCIFSSVILGLFSLGHFVSHFYDTTLDFCKMVIPGSGKNIKLIKVLEDHALFLHKI